MVILVALLMAGCGAKSSDTSSQTTESQESKPSASAVTPKSDGNVLHRVEQIYKDVAAEYAKYDEDFESMDDDGLDDRFCSDEWKGLVAKVVDFDSTNNPDEIGFFEYLDILLVKSADSVKDLSRDHEAVWIIRRRI